MAFRSVIPVEPCPTPWQGPAVYHKPSALKALSRRGDVIKVETALGNAGHLDLARTDGPLGLWSPRPEKAARSFREQNGPKVDGLLNPGGPTITGLKTKVGGLLSGRDRTDRIFHTLLDKAGPDQARALLGQDPPRPRPLGVSA